MNYHPSMLGDRTNVRYALLQKGSKTLYVVGLNPSTADDKVPDPTMRRVMAFAEHNGFDGFYMFNLYPQRTTKPEGLHKVVNADYIQKNLEIIKDTLSAEESPTVLFCYGANIGIRSYLVDCLQAILTVCDSVNAKKVCVGLTKHGHPKHPLYVRLGKFMEFTNIKK